MATTGPNGQAHDYWDKLMIARTAAKLLAELASALGIGYYRDKSVLSKLGENVGGIIMFNARGTT
jgi:hypothetical protein